MSWQQETITAKGADQPTNQLNPKNHRQRTDTENQSRMSNPPAIKKYRK